MINRIVELLEDRKIFVRQETKGPHDEAITDNVGSVLRNYLKWRKIGCDNPSGYEVTTYHIKTQAKNGGKNRWPVADNNKIRWEGCDNGRSR